MTLWLWVPSESALNSLLLAFYNITVTHNVLQYTTVEQMRHKFISLPPQTLIQQLTVLGSGLLSTANERDIDPLTNMACEKIPQKQKYYTFIAFVH